jgi:hypothetical protein
MKLTDVRNWLRHAIAMPRAVTDMNNLCHGLPSAVVVRLLDAFPKPSPPLVCVLVEAERADIVQTINFGGSGYVRSRDTVVELETYWPLKAVRCTAFVDLERVDVHGFFLGTDLVSAPYGTCAIARFPEWKVGLKLRVQCGLRDQARDPVQRVGQ